MSLLQYLFIIFTVLLLSIGQILFKVAALDFSLSSLLSIKVIFAILVYAVATIMWFMVLKTTPIKVAYPFVGLAFIIVPVLAHFFLQEQLQLNNLLGALVIGLGVLISVFK